MHALVVLSTSVHPLDNRDTYDPQAVQLTAWRSGVARPQTIRAVTHAPRIERGFVNTERYFAA